VTLESTQYNQVTDAICLSFNSFFTKCSDVFVKFSGIWNFRVVKLIVWDNMNF